MRTILGIVALIIVLGAVFGTSRGAMNPFSMVVAIVAIGVFGGVMRDSVKHGKNIKGAAERDLAEMNQRISQIEADIGDIKEQIADFIIKQV